ncbi:MAG: galactonate dehydratase [Candidatus Abyssobacteria bacterium SURF_5]|uniref:Galactonate dehydratase n=1 Tax=Abyssobacteria bacterium (strain SURF_5) TaxID=2093360 RepID=A0A3A4NWT5_ABYX5|nr:MAG: galactonate dehydratase [Candidatus Abyssubacteria bacterium SURF_5]
MNFSGYKREDGRFGTRNHVMVMSSVACANGVVDAISRALPEIVPLTHPYGCGCGPEDLGVMMRTLSGLLNNPNVGAALVIGHGCENLNSSFLTQVVENKPIEALVIQDSGGSAATTAKGIEIASRFLKQLERQERVSAPASELIIALECGGSDAFSGITANPAVGAAADLLVREGGTVILSETTEMIGTAHILKRRCATPELGEQVERLVNNHERHVRESLGELAGMVIAPGNIDGGLSSITEKSLGCIRKGGTTPITEIVEYAGKPTNRGFVIMDTPGYDIDSMAGMAAAGAQLILFTTGRGSVAGFPAIPVVKVCSNSRTFNKMPGDMDVNAGAITDAGKTIEEVGRQIFDLALEVASGKRTCAELNRSIPFNYLKQGPTF